MGKKKQQAQRTKDNARPSSSSRSAELLSNLSPNVFGISLQAVKTVDGGYAPALPTVECLTNNDNLELGAGVCLDPSFQLVLKKIQKKDKKTRCKALEEFVEACPNCEESWLESALTFWPRLYSTLVQDENHKVRKALQQAHAALMEKAGKKVAPYLKQLAGPWIASFYDNYAPAATIASNSFDTMFPDEKTPTAVAFCQESIIAYVEDNIKMQPDKKVESEDGGTIDKTLVMSLRALAFVLEKLPADRMTDKNSETLKRILESKVFWKIAKHESAPVKTAFFNLLTSLIKNATSLIDESAKQKAITTIGNSLDETEPLLVSAVWEAMLVVINNFQDWHLSLSVQKLFLPKLWRVLSSEEQNCSAIIYPNLLPLLSQFPKFDLDRDYLYNNFFEKLRGGFSSKNVALRRTFAQSLTNSYVECLRYAIHLHKSDEFSIKLLKDQLIPTLECCMKEGSRLNKNLFCNVAQVTKYWGENKSDYSNLLKEFWISVRQMIVTGLKDSSEGSITYLECFLNSEFEFISTLKENTSPSPSRKVRFNSEDADENCDSAESEAKESTNKTDCNGELIDLINYICSYCIEQIDKRTEKEFVVTYLRHLSKLIDCFDVSSDLLKTFECTCIVEFFEKKLKRLIVDAEDEKEIEIVLSLVFNLIRKQKYKEEVAFCNTLMELGDKRITRIELDFVLSRDSKEMREWRRQPRVSQLIIQVAEDLISDPDHNFERNKAILLSAFKSDSDSEIVIEKQEAEKIASILCNFVTNSEGITSESRAFYIGEIIAEISSLIWDSRSWASVVRLMLETLFTFNLQWKSDDNSEVNPLKEVLTEGLSQYQEISDEDSFVQLIKTCSNAFWKKTFSSERLESSVVDLAVDFATTISSNENELNETIDKTIFAFLFEDKFKAWLFDVTRVILLGELVEGNLDVYEEELVKIQFYGELADFSVNVEEINQIDVVGTFKRCLKWAHVTFQIIQKIECLRKVNNKSFPLTVELITNLVYVENLCNLFKKQFKATKSYWKVRDLIDVFTSAFFIKHFGASALKNIKDKFREQFHSFKQTTLQIKANVEREILEDTPACFNPMINDEAAKIANLYQKPTNFQTALDVMSEIVEKYRQKSYTPKELVYRCDITDVSWEQLTLCLAVNRAMTRLVADMPRKLSAEHWDLILISLGSWQETIGKTKIQSNNLKHVAFVISTMTLYSQIKGIMTSSENFSGDDALSPTLLEEWNAVFAGDIEIGIMKCWMHQAESANQKKLDEVPPLARLLLESLSKAVGKVSKENVIDENDKLNIDRVMKISCLLLNSSMTSVQLATHYSLQFVVPELVSRDRKIIERENFDSNALNIRKFEEPLLNMQKVVNALLMDHKLCDRVSCYVQPFTDSYTYTLGYLLTWHSILKMCSVADSDLRYHYAEVLKNEYLDHLLNNIFKLMPFEALEGKKSDTGLINMFSKSTLDFSSYDSTGINLDHAVCCIYMKSLRHLPVLVRQWWSTFDSRISNIVDRVTTLYCSEILCREQLFDERLAMLDNITLKVFASGRQAIALYQMDETKLELSITLPSNYPLGSVLVEAVQPSGSSNWRNCHKQLAIFLTHQNGSIRDGLILWKKNLDKRFAGVEECCICYSVLYLNQLPKLSCSKCKKKFHTPCLYKWFNTSQKSTCPICRNVF